MNHIPEQPRWSIHLMISWSRHWCWSSNHQSSNTVRPGDMELTLKRRRGWLAAVSGTEEQSAGQILVNAARHQVFPDVQVMLLEFLLWQSDLGTAAPITCCSIHPWVIALSLQQWQSTASLTHTHTQEWRQNTELTSHSVHITGPKLHSFIRRVSVWACSAVTHKQLLKNKTLNDSDVSLHSRITRV